MAKTYKAGIWFEFAPDGEHAGVFDDIKGNPDAMNAEIVRLTAQDIAELAFIGGLDDAVAIETEGRTCTCEKPDALGWHVVDNAGISFGGLKQAQNEASRDAAQYIAHIFFTKSEKIFNDLMELIVDNENANVFGGYRETCEWLADEC